MFQSDLRPVPGSTHKKKRVGRGNASGHGTYSGRGIKGQKSRTGRDLRIGFEGGQIPLVRALSRVRGFNNKFRVEFEPVNLDRLAVAVANGEVTPESLKRAGVVKSNLPIKVLANGEVGQKLKVTAHRFSATAQAKIEAAGGSVIVLLPPKEKKAKKEKKTKKAPPAAGQAAPATPKDDAPSTEAPPAEAPPAEAPKAKAPKAEARKAEARKAEAPAAEAPAAKTPAPRTRRRTPPPAEPDGKAE
jgi:large subunit ribosomal protein L15